MSGSELSRVLTRAPCLVYSRIMKHFMTFSALALLVAACSSHDIGQDCRTLGSTSECSDNLICATNNVEQLICSKVCTVYTDCAADEDCVQVGGSGSKACRAR